MTVMEELLKKDWFIVTTLACIPMTSGAPASVFTDPSESNNWFLTHPSAVVILSACALVLTAILFLVQCGGCTEMEVGSENHPASGGKSTNTAVTYSSPMDSNYDSNNAGAGAGLPYALSPNMNTTAGFAGYQTVGGNNLGGYGQGNMQTAGGYQAPVAPSAPSIQTQGYQVQNPPPNAPAPGPHAHRPAVEPPPPTYNESVRSGWVTR